MEGSYVATWFGHFVAAIKTDTDYHRLLVFFFSQDCKLDLIVLSTWFVDVTLVRFSRGGNGWGWDDIYEMNFLPHNRQTLGWG
jgi:hypothetical protein